MAIEDLRQILQAREQQRIEKERKRDGLANAIAKAVGGALAPFTFGASMAIPATTTAVTGSTGRVKQDPLAMAVDIGSNALSAGTGAAGAIGSPAPSPVNASSYDFVTKRGTVASPATTTAPQMSLRPRPLTYEELLYGG